MKKLNTTLDREPMTSQMIRDRQDFNYILKEANAAKVPIWKSIWFYGPVGIAMVTMVVSAVRMNSKSEQFDNTTTLSQFRTIPTNTDFSANTIEVKKSEELTETKSNSKKENSENEAPLLSKTKAVTPSNTTTPKTEAVPSSMEPAFLVDDDDGDLIDEPIVIKKPTQPRKAPSKPSMTLANIAGVFNGRVALSDICYNGLTCNNGYRVISYDIQYDNGTGETVDRVSGNGIPEVICRSLKRYNIGSPVFITRIIAENGSGERKQLLSMSIEPTF